MARIHLVIGPVGAGKSTYARRLVREHRAVAFDLDDWMVRLFRPDRPETDVMPWYVERTARCIAQIWEVTRGVLAVDRDVVLEIGLLRRHERESLYAKVDAEAFDLSVHVLDAPRDVRRARVLARNEVQGDTFSMVVPPEIFELASDMWQPPTPDELEGRDARWMSTG